MLRTRAGRGLKQRGRTSELAAQVRLARRFGAVTLGNSGTDHSGGSVVASSLQGEWMLIFHPSFL